MLSCRMLLFCMLCYYCMLLCCMFCMFKFLNNSCILMSWSTDFRKRHVFIVHYKSFWLKNQWNKAFLNWIELNWRAKNLEQVITYLQVNSSLIFTSHNTIAYMRFPCFNQILFNYITLKKKTIIFGFFATNAKCIKTQWCSKNV